MKKKRSLKVKTFLYKVERKKAIRSVQSFLGKTYSGLSKVFADHVDKKHPRKFTSKKLFLKIARRIDIISKAIFCKTF